MENEHYSDRGGHKERSTFWSRLRRLTGNKNPSREQQHMIRRDMMRPQRKEKRKING